MGLGKLKCLKFTENSFHEINCCQQSNFIISAPSQTWLPCGEVRDLKCLKLSDGIPDVENGLDEQLDIVFLVGVGNAP